MKVIRAVGDYAVIELKRETTKSGILTRLGNVGKVVSCRKKVSQLHLALDPNIKQWMIMSLFLMR